MMKKNIYMLLVALSTTLLCQATQIFFVRNLTKLKSLLHGQPKIQTDTDYACRYNIIKPFLDQYKRSFTLLDLATHSNLEGSLGINIAKEYNCVCVIGAGNQKAYTLREACKSQAIHNVIILHENIYEKKLQRMSECEKCDVILLFNQSQHLSPEKINLLLALGQHIIVETPGENKIAKKLKECLVSHKAKHIGTIQGKLKTNIYLLKSKNHTLTRIAWAKSNMTNAKYYIKSTFEKKELIKHKAGKIITTPWIPGLNLLTFKICYGIYPEKPDVKKAIIDIIDHNHQDWFPPNMIVQGKKISLIDFEKQPNPLKYSKKLLDVIFTFVDFEETDKEYATIIPKEELKTDYEKRYYGILSLFKKMLLLKDKPVSLMFYKEPDTKCFFFKQHIRLKPWIIVPKKMLSMLTHIYSPSVS